jgi:hypothetical protein
VNRKVNQAIVGQVWIPRQTAGGLAAYDMRE